MLETTLWAVLGVLGVAALAPRPARGRRKRFLSPLAVAGGSMGSGAAFAAPGH